MTWLQADAEAEARYRSLDALAQVPASIGAFLAALKDDSWRKVAEANREELFALGLWGVPSFRVNQNRPHWGQDRLWAIEQELQQVNR